MIYNDFKGQKLSALGFGTMRLPLLEDGKTIDVKATEEMIDLAIESGVNYFDTAAPYHGGLSEIVVGRILSKYPRDTWNLATKFPGHQHYKNPDPAPIFEEQLRKCGVDRFDFYLFHNVCENSIEDYMNPKWGILDYFIEQRRLGRVGHLGLSTHGEPEFLRALLDGPYGREIEFIQIQVNYLDWDLQKAAEKLEIIKSHNIPVWVMEPVRGGRLASLGEADEAALKALRPDESTAAWAFRFLQDIPEVAVTLSGMSSKSQVEDNLRTYSEKRPLSAPERAKLFEIAAGLHSTVPCTACRYCCDGCPAGLNIPQLISAYNDLSLQFAFAPMMLLESLAGELRPSACLGCGACTRICPQNIDVPGVMEKLSALYDKYPKWSVICKEREAEAEALRKK